MSVKSLALHLGLGIKKHAPTLLVISGIATGVAAGIVAIKKTPKLYEVTKEDKKSLERIKENLEDPSARAVINQGDVDDEPTYVPYDEKLYKEDKNKIVRNIIKNTVVTYSVPAGMAIAAITMILLGYRLKCKALIAMTAAFNSTMAAFKTYRGRVVERYGADVDNDIYLGKDTIVVEEIDEDGNVKVEEKTVINPVGKELVLRFAPDTTKYHRNDISYIHQFLETTARIACNQYDNRSTKHMYLTEITDALGLDRDLAHSGLGWSEKLDSETNIANRINLSNVWIDNEDGTYVGYIPITVDGYLS